MFKSATHAKKNALSHNRQHIAHMHANSYAEGAKRSEIGIDYGLEQNRESVSDLNPLSISPMRNYQSNTESKLEIMPSKAEVPRPAVAHDSGNLIDSLKYLNIELLDDREKEKLRSLSLQF